jgi:hypothetical protein
MVAKVEYNVEIHGRLQFVIKKIGKCKVVKSTSLRLAMVEQYKQFLLFESEKD